MSKDQTRIAVVTAPAASASARASCDQGWRASSCGIATRLTASRWTWPTTPRWRPPRPARRRRPAINAAGIAGSRDPVARKDPAEWAQVMAVNLNGTFHCAHAV